VADRVALVVGERGTDLAETVQARDLVLAERADVVDGVGSEQLVEAVELALVDEMPVQGSTTRGTGAPSCSRRRRWAVAPSLRRPTPTPRGWHGPERGCRPISQI